MIDEEELTKFNVQRAAAPQRRMGVRRYLAIGAIAVAVAALGAFAWRTIYFYTMIKSGTPVDLSELSSRGAFTADPKAGGVRTASQATGYADRQDAPSFGAPSNKAAITMVQFVDFECPFSRDAYPTMRELMNQHKDTMRFAVRFFPISDIHPHALAAAEASLCAQDQGKFWPYYDTLFQNQSALSPEDLKRYAEQIGLDTHIFSACVNSNVHYKEVMSDYETGLQAGVAGTPTFFVNGQKVEGVIPKDEWQKALKLFK